MIQGLLTKTLDKQFIKFLLTGGLNTAFGYALFALCNLIIGNAYLAIILSTIIGVIFNFKTYGKFVFNSNDHSRVFRFCGVYLLLIVLQMLSLKTLKLIGIDNSYLAGLIIVIPLAGLSFFLMRKFVFSFVPVLDADKSDDLKAR
ncbi:MAG: GtrA family protein [Cyclobacteriaceae bacterium]|nr:GtrA family protein [Cyclobacteriaceae bacterium]